MYAWRLRKTLAATGDPLDETRIVDVSPQGNGRVPATPPTPASGDPSGSPRDLRMTTVNSGSGSGVIFGALARSGRTTPGLSAHASVAYSFLQRVLSVVVGIRNMWQASDSSPAMRGANKRPARPQRRRYPLFRSLPSERANVKRHSLPGACQRSGALRA
jgi:hypothetical protein